GLIELFENDLINFDGPPRALRQLADDRGLTIEVYQPFRDFEGVSDDVFRRNLDRAERKFDVMGELRAPIMLVCSNVSPGPLPKTPVHQPNCTNSPSGPPAAICESRTKPFAWGMHVRTLHTPGRLLSA